MKRRRWRSQTECERAPKAPACARLALASIAWTVLGVAVNAAGEVTIQSVETAHRQGSLDALERQAQDVSALLVRSTGSDELRHRYTLAFIAWRTSHLWKSESGGGNAREKQLQSAREQLEIVLERDPSNVEALALCTAVLGELADVNLLSRIMLGRKALRSLERAEKLAPENPRVALQRGVFSLHTPEFAGGGAEVALAALERARSLFDAQPRPAPWPDWGRVEVAAWLGQTLVKLGRGEEARTRYREGLAIPPPSPWILRTLLPELDGEPPTRSR